MNNIIENRIEKAALEYRAQIEKRNDNAEAYNISGFFIDGANFALQHQWISVDEELPKVLDNEVMSEYVFVRMNDNNNDCLRYHSVSKSWYDYRGDGHWGITHWMPIPKVLEIDKNKEVKENLNDSAYKEDIESDPDLD